MFYLSHVDRDAKSAAGNPPSPLVEELTGFLATAYGEQAWKTAQSLIVRQHPMHAFAPECFRTASGAPSYDRRWWNAARKLLEGWVDPAPFVADFEVAPLVVDAAADWTEVSIDELLAWLRHPTRAFFRHQLPLHLHEAEQDEDVEAFTLDGLSRYQLADRLLGPLPSRPDLKRVQREGDFPLGIAGQQAWDTLTAQVDALEQRAMDLLGGRFESVTLEMPVIELADLRVRVSGTIRHLVQAANGRRFLLLSRPGKIRGIDLARLMLERALFGNDENAPAMLAIGLDKGETTAVSLKPADDMLEWVHNLLVWRTRGLQRPLPAFRNSAEAFAASMHSSGDVEQARKVARAIWSDGDYPENADPHHELIGRHHGDAMLDESFEDFAMALFLPLFDAVEEIK